MGSWVGQGMAILVASIDVDGARRQWTIGLFCFFFFFFSFFFEKGRALMRGRGEEGV